MDIEQLRMILNTLGSAGEGAFTIALLWVFKSYVGYLLTFTVLFLIYRGVRYFIACVTHLDEIAEAFDYLKPSMVSSPEGRRIVDELVALGKEHVKRQEDDANADHTP